MRNRTRIIVTGADSGYFDFARDAVESVRACRVDDLSLGFLDLGLTDQQKRWLEKQRVMITTPTTLLNLPRGVQYTTGQMGYLARPFLRESFPGFDTYLWIDADAWIQAQTGLERLIAGAETVGAAVVRENERAYRFWAWKVGWMHKHFTLGYGVARGLPLAWRPMINNGVFAMRADAPHWDAWRRHYQSALTRTRLAAPHDQFALNAAVYLDRLPTAFLGATENWICDLATPMWDDEGQRFCVPYAPYDTISILHLAGPAKTSTPEIQRRGGGSFRRHLRRRV